MATRAARQRQFRDQWESESARASHAKSSDDIQQLIRMEIEEQRKLEESLLRSAQRDEEVRSSSAEPVLEDGAAVTAKEDRRATVGGPPPTRAEAAAATQPLPSQESSAADSGAYSESETSELPIDEDAFAEQRLSLERMKSYWEVKHRILRHQEETHLNDQLHLESLRQRARNTSPWSESMKRGQAASRPAAAAGDVQPPTCDVVEWCPRERPVLRVEQMKHLWDDQLLRSPDSETASRTPGEQLVVSEMRDDKRREREWQASLTRRSGDDTAGGSMARSQSMSSLHFTFVAPTPAPAEPSQLRIKKPKMLHERILRQNETLPSPNRPADASIEMPPAPRPSTGRSPTFTNTIGPFSPDYQSSNSSQKALLPNGNLSSSQNRPQAPLSAINTSSQIIKSERNITLSSPNNPSESAAAAAARPSKPAPTELGAVYTYEPGQSNPSPLVQTSAPSTPGKNRKFVSSRAAGPIAAVTPRSVDRYRSKAKPAAAAGENQVRSTAPHIHTTETTETKVANGHASGDELDPVLMDRKFAQSAVHKRTSVNKSWDKVCRKSEPSITF